MTEDQDLKARFHRRILDAYQQTGETARAHGQRIRRLTYGSGLAVVHLDELALACQCQS